MHCGFVKDHIERYIDNSLSDRIRAEFEKHLNVCPICAAAYSEAESVRKLVEIPLPAVPNDLAEAVIISIRVSGNSFKNCSDWFFSRWWNEVSAPARVVYASIILLIMTGGIFISKDFDKKSESMTYTEYSENDAFSAVPQGSLELALFKMAASVSTEEDR
jgi:predicted anti-sigma-YlaC factor YlaD